MTKLQKRRLKKKILKNIRILLFPMFLIFIITLSCAYALFNTNLSVSGKVTLGDKCYEELNATFNISKVNEYSEIATIKLNNYENVQLNKIVMNIKFPLSTKLKVNNYNVKNTVDGYLYTNKEGIVSIEFEDEFNPIKESQIELILEYSNINNILYPSLITINNCKVYEKEVANNELEKIDIPKKTYEIKQGEVIPIQIIKYPEDSTVNITWTSSDQSVVKVNDGVVTANNKGSAIITARYNNIVSTTQIIVN